MTAAFRRSVVVALCLWLLIVRTGAAGRERASAGTVSIVHYDVHLTLDVGQGRVSGTAVLTAVGRGGESDSVQLDSGDLIVEQVTVEGHDLAFSSADHHLVVRFPRAMRDGERWPLVGDSSRSTTRHSFFQGAAGLHSVLDQSWLVCVDAPDQKATLRLSVTGPEWMDCDRKRAAVHARRASE
jgi:aminopeptidase N